MSDDQYTLGDLARLADVTARTVRYYVAQGLLPSPEAAGPATRYGEGHLARLRLIRRLQREHLPLAEIRLRLERMGDDDVIATVRNLAADEPAREPTAGDALAYVRALMAGSGIVPSVADAGTGGARVARMEVADSLEAAWSARHAVPPLPASSPPAPSPSRAMSPLLRSMPAPPPASSAPSAGSEAPGARPVIDRSTWERLAITPDIELHVRRPLDRIGNKRVEQLVRIARELFGQD